MIDERKLIEDIKRNKLLAREAATCRCIEYINNQPQVQQWIPCSEKLPEEAFPCLVTVLDTNPMTMEDFNNILPYFVGYDGESWNDGDGEVIPFEVIAWQPLPAPYKPKED